MTSSEWDAWNFRSGDIAPAGQNLVGFSVHATDGRIGKIDEQPWTLVRVRSWSIQVLGSSVAGHSSRWHNRRIDVADENVYVDLTNDQIKDSPELNESADVGPAYRDELDTYYGDTYRRSTP